jgi:hypothetical protein
MLLADEEDGVSLQLALFLEQPLEGRWNGFGFYGNVALTKRLGSAGSSTAPSNIDLGLTYAHYIRASESVNWLVARAGMLVPTGAADDVRGGALHPAGVSPVPGRLASLPSRSI